MEKQQSCDFKVELFKENFLFKTLLFMIMLFTISVGTTAASYLLLTAL